MFLTKSDDAIPFFKSRPMMKIGLVIAALGILVAGLYSPFYDYIYNISSAFLNL